MAQLQDKKENASLSAISTAETGKEQAQSKPKRHRRCWCLFKFGLSACLLFLVGLGALLYYLLFTTDGARQGLKVAQQFIPQSIIIDTTIESGSVYEGLVLGKTLVDIKDVVAITADDLVLHYDLTQLLNQERLFKVQELTSSHLTVALSDALFVPKPKEPEPPAGEPFRLVFPVGIDIDRFLVTDFNFTSQIVDVAVGELDSVLWARADNLGVTRADVDTVTVHLKNQDDVAADKAEAIAADQFDESLALAVDGTITPLTDLEGTVNAVVRAAQEGKSVEMVVVREHQQAQAAATEKDILRALKPNFTPESVQAVAEAKKSNDKAFSDPERFALAMEEALLNNTEAPALVNEHPAIHDPRVSQFAAADTQVTAQSPESTVAESVSAEAAPAESAPAAMSAAQGEAVGAATTEQLTASADSAGASTDSAGASADSTSASTQSAGASADSAGASADSTSASTQSAGASAQSADESTLAGASTAGSDAEVAARDTSAADESTSNSLQSEQVADSYEQQLLASAPVEVASVDAAPLPAQSATPAASTVAGATAASGAGAELVGIGVGTAPVKAIVKEFGSGNGAIETLPTIVLPFNLEVKSFVIKKGRYYMQGFDTQEVDLALKDSTWYDTKLVVGSFDVKHEFGEAQLLADLDLSQYFALNVKLTGEGYQNDATHDFLQGLLYGLRGDIAVSGDLTDLTALAQLNLGGATTLKAHANLLSGALPLMVELTARDFTYPIFGEPLVNLKEVNFAGSGNLVDGVDVNLDALVTGFDFKDVKTKLAAQMSYEKTHIDYFTVAGTYLEEKLAADISGDFFYGKLLGVDAKVYAQVKDAGFISPLLKGPLQLDGDVVAIMNQNDKAKSALSVASEPVYLEYRIPKTSVMLEDFDADTIESRLLSSVKEGRTELKSVATPHSASTEVAATSNAEEASLLSGSNYHEVTHEATDSAVKAIQSGKSLAKVRPLKRNQELLAGGVPDGPQDLLITPEEYVEAVRFGTYDAGLNQDEVSALLASTSLDGVVTDEDLAQFTVDGALTEPTFLQNLFNNELPEVMTNIRHINGELYFNGQKTTIAIKDIVGDLHQGFRVELLKVTQGPNMVLAQGQITENGADLNTVVDVQDISTLVPKLEGSLSAYLMSSGSIHDLNFELSGTAPLIRSGDMRVRKLVFNSAFNMQTRALNFTAMADRVRLAKGMAANRQCFIDLSGTPLRHNLSANCGGATAGYISIDGSLDLQNQYYNANLLEMYLSTESAGALSLASPVYVSLALSDMSGSVSPVELRGEIGQVNLSDTVFSSSYTESHLVVSQFNLSSLSDFFPESVRMMVPLDVTADVVIDRGNPDITLNVSSAEGAIFSTVGAGIVYDSLNFESRLTKAALHNNLQIQLRNNRGVILSEVRVADPMGAGRLSGDFRIIDFDLRTISNVGQSFNELKGFTNVNATFGGTLSAPQVFGVIKSKGSAIPRYDVGQINDFDLNIELNGQQGNLDGTIVLNERELKLAGALDWSNGPNGALTATARELPVFLVGYGSAAANLDAQVTLGEILDIKGEVEIPRALISVNDVSSSGTSVSGDEILVPQEGTQALMHQAPSNFKSAMDLKVRMGDEVRFSAMGMVEGRLGGGLNITKRVSDNTIRASGEINIVDGAADVYGRRFNFATARVLFKNEIANPSLNIEVVADEDSLEDDVQVGIRVTGTASAPDINLFSKPNMSQNEILSYILYGHGLDKNVLQQDSNNSNLLLGLGVSGISGLATGIAESFGVRDIQFNTEGSGDDMQVAVQGYITRKLRLSYGYGIFSTIGEFKLRYELIDSFYVEFISALNQTVDLIYSFDFD